MNTFKGGIHPDDNKLLSCNQKTEIFKIPEKVVIPLSQHLGKPSKPIVHIGDEVRVGQLIGEADGFISANVHSSVSGKVESIEKYNHPCSGFGLSIIIKTDFEKEQEISLNKIDWEKYQSQEIKDIIKNAGIVGMGGATFPTNVKLSPPADKKIDTIIINAVECEPYLTADHRLMLENTDEIIEGAKIIKKITGIDNIYIGIEANKKDAYQQFENKKSFLKPVLLKVKYPQGAEKQLIDAVLQRKIPPGKLPMDVGTIVLNVGTVYAIYEAVCLNKPLIERILTVSGRGIVQPKNLKVRIGTIWNELINYCGGIKPDIKRLIMGGPMMGVAQFTDNVPVTKGTSGILLLSEEEVGFVEEEVCIKCGKCVRGCPMNLMPATINRYMELNKIEELFELNILDCIECGTCAYVCPANKKIIQKIRKYKPKVMDWARKNGRI